MAQQWVPVDGAAKNDAGEYQALVGGKWQPAAGAAKNDAGQYMALMDAPAQPGIIDHTASVLSAPGAVKSYMLNSALNPVLNSVLPSQKTSVMDGYADGSQSKPAPAPDLAPLSQAGYDNAVNTAQSGSIPVQDGSLVSRAVTAASGDSRAMADRQAVGNAAAQIKSDQQARADQGAAFSRAHPIESGIDDAVRSVGTGALGLGQMATNLAYAGTKLDALKSSADNLGDLSHDLESGLSPEMKAAKDKKFINDDWTAGDAWSDPRSYLFQIYNQTGSALPMLGAGRLISAGAEALTGLSKLKPAIDAAGVAAGNAVKTAISDGVEKTAAAQLGKEAAQATFAEEASKLGVANASLDQTLGKLYAANLGGQTIAGTYLHASDAANAAMTQISQMDDMQLMNSPEYASAKQGYMNAGMPEEQAQYKAKEDIRREAGLTAAAVTGSAALPFQLIMSHVNSKLFTGGMGYDSRLKNFGSAIATESPANAAELGMVAFGGNVGVQQHADPTVPLGRDVANTAIGAGIGAVGMSAPHAIVAPRVDAGAAPVNSLSSGVDVTQVDQRAITEDALRALSPTGNLPTPLTEKAAEASARQKSIVNGEPYQVIGHPAETGKFTAVPVAVAQEVEQKTAAASQPNASLATDYISGGGQGSPTQTISAEDAAMLQQAENFGQAAPVEHFANGVTPEALDSFFAASRAKAAAKQPITSPDTPHANLPAMPENAQPDSGATGAAGNAVQNAVQPSAGDATAGGGSDTVGSGMASAGAQLPDGATMDDVRTATQPQQQVGALDESILPANPVDAAAHDAATSPLNGMPEPTDAMKHAGNYKKGHVTIHGLDVAIENPKGSERSGVEKDGSPWSITMPDHYGYINRTEGADGDHVDTFIGSNPESDKAFVVDQVNADTGEFEQHKVMLGFDNADNAMNSYRAAFNDGRGHDRIGAVTSMNMEQLKSWLKEGDTKKALAPQITKPDARSASSQEPASQAAPETSLPVSDVTAPPVQNVAATIRPHVEQIIKRRAVGQEIKRGDYYGLALQEAKNAMNGKKVDPNKLRKHAIAFASDEKLSGAFNGIADTIEAQNKPAQTAAKQPKALLSEADKARRAELQAEAEQLGIKNAKFMGLDAMTEAVAKRKSEMEANAAIDRAAAAKEAADRLASNALSENEIADIEDAVSKQYGDKPDHIQQEKMAEALEAAINNKLNEGQNAESKAIAGQATTRATETGGKRSGEQTVGKDHGAAQGEEVTHPAAESAPIEDFGEKLHGAKKDLWHTYRKAMSDELPADLKEVTLSKHFPEPDYEGLIANGTDIRAVAAIKAMRDEIPAKPKLGYKLQRWGEQFKTLRGFSNDILSGIITVDRVVSDMRKERALEDIADRIDLYSELGYPALKSAKGYEISGGWTLPNAPGEQFGLRTPGHGVSFFNTRQEAVDALRSKLATEPETKDGGRSTKLDIYRITATGDIVIGKKLASNKFIDLKSGFSSGKEAREYLSQHEGELLELLEKKKETPPERRSVNNPRIGKDHRLGEDVTPEKFASEFGFRGVQFGNYVEQGRRGKDLNNAYDALLDLSSTLGIPPRAISLNGTLGLAFGARGSGKAAAHYEADQVVINLTKTNGHGSLGHEWFHALDNYFSRMRGENGKFLTEHPRQKMVRGTGNALVADESVRPEVLGAFERVMKAIKSAEFYKSSGNLDGRRTKDYWSTDIELAARAFESYLIAKAQERGEANDYLANVVDEEVWKAAEGLEFEEDNTYPYPTRADQEKLNPLFDALFKTLQTKETEKGVALYSHGEHAGGQTVESITKATTKLRARWLGFRRVKIVQSVREIPNDLYLRALRALKPINQSTEGVYDPKSNTVYLIADNIASPERAAWVAVHEVVGHAGLRMLDAKVDEHVTELAKNTTVAKLAKAIAADRGETFKQATHAEEAIAELAAASFTNGEQALFDRYGVKATGIAQDGLRGMVLRMIDAIRRFLSVVMGKKVDEVSDAYVRSVINSARRAVEGGEQSGQQGSSGYALASMRGNQAKDFEQFARRYVDSLPVDARENERQIDELADEIMHDWSMGNSDDITGSFGPNEIYATLHKESEEKYFDADGDLTDEGGQRYNEIERKLASDAAREHIGAPARSEFELSNPANMAKVLHAYLEQSGFDVNAISGSGKSQSKYFEIMRPDGNVKIRISDHELPSEYGGAEEELRLYDVSAEDVRGDGRNMSVGIDADEAMARANDFVSHLISKYGNAAPANSAKLGFSASDKTEMQERTMRANNPVSSEPAQSDVARGGGEDSAPNRSGGQVEVRTIGFPADSTVISDFTKDGAMKMHAQYKAAKGGDIAAAVKLVSYLVKPSSIEAAREKFGADVAYVPVMAQEASGKNQIPNALASYYAEQTGGMKASGIYQTNKAYHTGADAMERLVARSEYGGKVIPGQRYVLVDDVSTMGGTLADMASYIQSQGGVVSGAVVLTNASRSGSMAPDAKTIRSLEVRHGQAIRELFGVEPSALTRDEAQYLIGFRTTDELRNRAASAIAERGRRVLSKAVPESANPPALSQSDAPLSSSAPSGTAPLNLNATAAHSIPEETEFQKRQRQVQDKMNRFKVLQAWLNHKGVKLTDKANVHEVENLMHAKIANQTEDFRNNIEAPLLERAAKAGFTLEQLADYLEAQHIPEANARMRDIHQDANATANGISDAEANATLAQFQSMPKFAEFKEIADGFRAIGDETLNMRLKEGLISQEQYDAYKATYQHWVPLRGDGKKPGVGKGLSVNAKEKRRLGHGERDNGEYIIENLLMDRERAIYQIEHNRVVKSIIQFALEAKEPDMITVGKPEKRQVLKNQTVFEVQYKGKMMRAFSSENDAKAFINQAIALSAQNKGGGMARADFAIGKTGDPIVVMQASPMLAENEIQGYVAGHAIRIQLNDELLARAATNMGVDQLNMLLGAARWINNGLSKMYTAYSPDFIFRNAIRDFIAGTINLTGDMGVKMAGKIYANYGKAAKELFIARNDPSKSAWVQKYRAAGGNTGAAYLSDIERIGNNAQIAMYEHMKGLAAYRTEYARLKEEGRSEKYARTVAAAKFIRARAGAVPVVGHFLTLIEHLNAVTENALRLATYMTLVQNGYTEQKAAVAAKNSTVNFNRKGEISNVAGSLYLFFNPSVQGSSRMFGSLLTSENKGQAWALAGMLAFTAFALAEMGRGGGDDDERKWKNIPDYVKDHNLILKHGDLQWTIPVPYEFAPFHVLGNSISDAVHGEGGWKAAIKVLKSIVDNTMPLGDPFTGDGKDGLNLFQMTPTLVKMALASHENENSFGAPIQPEKASYNQNKPDSQNMFRNTKGTLYSGAAEWVNEMTGGSKYRAGGVDVSPETLKFWVSTLTGGTGRFVADMGNAIWGGAHGVAPDLSDTPIARVFAREASVADARSRFWEAANDAKAAADAFAMAKKAHDSSAIKEMHEADGDMILLSRFADRIGKAAAKQRNLIDAIRMDDQMPLAQKREQMKAVEQKEQEYYDRFLKVFDQKQKAKLDKAA